MVSGTGQSLVRQLAAAGQAAAAVAAEWAERAAAAVRELMETMRGAAPWMTRDCECSCASSHPDDVGVCDHRAVIIRRLAGGTHGRADVLLCAPCAVAQGIAELARYPAPARA